MSNAEPSRALRADHVQAVFYILFYRVIQEDAWEKAGEGGPGLGRGAFLPLSKGLLYFYWKLCYDSIVTIR
jgi:hypothetical protein